MTSWNATVPVDLALLVTAKEPLPGRVKTRLCPPCTPEEAAAIAAGALADTLDAVRRARVTRRVLAICGDCAAPGLDVVHQRGDGLAERIALAVADASALGSGPVLQLGMDTPQAGAHLLERCGRALLRDGVDAVLGPAQDGGWWALGVREPAMAQAILGVPMSTERTGRLALGALRRAGLRVALVPSLRDVDTITDALTVAAQAPNGAFAAAVRLGRYAGAAAAGSDAAYA